MAAQSQALVSAAGRLMGLRVRILVGTWLSLVSVLGCQVEVFATGRSLVQEDPTVCVFDQVQQ